MDLGLGTYDLLVIGGGITGAGIAREAALRGLRVALVERNDFACGTSSRSTKLIHGGLRYLKNMDLRLVREAVQERVRLLQMAPHLVKVRQFLFPVYKGDPDAVWKLRIGLTLYDWFAGKGNPIPHRILGAGPLAELEPQLATEGLVGGGIYCDAATDDGRLTLAVIKSAIGHGAAVRNYTEVTSFLYGGGGHISGAVVRDSLTGDTAEVRATTVVAAAGPWADRVRRMDDPYAEPLLRLTKGVHVTFPAERLPIKNAVVIRGADGRMMFAIPAGPFSYVGTTDTDYQGDPEDVTVDRSDVSYILDAARRAFPGADLTEADINSTWAGLRPLVRPAHGESPSATSRDYAIRRSPSGLVSIAGGKLTAFRAMAAHIVDDLFPATRNRHSEELSGAPLPGAEGALPTAPAVALLAAQTGAHLGMVADLAARYGSEFDQVADELTPGGEPELIWLRAQLRHAVKHEMARRLEDVYARRTGALLFSRGNGRAYVEELAAEMGDLLGWPMERVLEEQLRTHAAIDAMFTWRHPLDSSPFCAIN